MHKARCPISQGITQHCLSVLLPRVQDGHNPAGKWDALATSCSQQRRRIKVMQMTITLPFPGPSAFLCKYDALNVTFPRKILEPFKKRQTKQAGCFSLHRSKTSRHCVGQFVQSSKVEALVCHADTPCQAPSKSFYLENQSRVQLPAFSSCSGSKD